MRPFLRVAALCGLAAATPLHGFTAGTGGAAVASADLELLTTPPGEVDGSMRTVMTRRYRMSGKIRPLLFWIGKDDIGLARIAWRRGDDGAVGYELLVGTDPAKAPRALNRWGYITEDATGAEGSLLALMTGADETSYDEAASNASRAPAGGDFRAISGRLRNGTASSQTVRVATPAALTVHDVEATLARVRRETDAASRRDTRAPSGARPGFLTAVAELIRVAADGLHQNQDPRAIARQRVQYVFGQGAYELSLRDVSAERVPVGGAPIPAIRTAFEIRTLSTDVRTRFEVTCGRDGDLAGVPVSISWQPRWWLRVALTLED
jgi:hypothetical protein